MFSNQSDSVSEFWTRTRPMRSLGSEHSLWITSWHGLCRDVSLPVLKTLNTSPQRSPSARSGDRGDHAVGSPRPIHRPGKNHRLESLEHLHENVEAYCPARFLETNSSPDPLFPHSQVTYRFSLQHILNKMTMSGVNVRRNMYEMFSELVWQTLLLESRKHIVLAQHQ
jgi:hypothetical protein